MNNTNMKDGQHFWAEMDGKLVMMAKSRGSYYVCGGWEGTIKENKFEFVQLVDMPEGYETVDLLYTIW